MNTGDLNKNKVKHTLIDMAKRTFSVALIVFGISFVAFFLSYLTPGDPISLQLEAMGIAPEEELVSVMKEERGLNEPFLIQYGNWVKGMLTGNLGKSVVTGNEISEDFARYLPNTLKLTFVSLLTSMGISLLLGILCAIYANSLFDYVVGLISYLFASFPSFFLALMMLLVFGSILGWFPIIAHESARGMVMPVMLLTFGIAAYYVRQIRAIILDQLTSDYVVGCRARGVPFASILVKHVLRNSLVPIITMVGISFGGLLGGASIVESIFSWRGIGLYALNAIQKLDYTVIQTYVAWMAMIYLGVNLIVELVCGFVDPRIKTMPDGDR